VNITGISLQLLPLRLGGASKGRRDAGMLRAAGAWAQFKSFRPHLLQKAKVVVLSLENCEAKIVSIPMAVNH
jgi:hypothetical protein